MQLRNEFEFPAIFNSEKEKHTLKIFLHLIWLLLCVGLFKGMSKDHFIPKSTVTPGKILIYQTDFIRNSSEIGGILVFYGTKIDFVT